VSNVTVLTASQRRVVALGWITYAAFYLGRVNLAAALPAIQTDFVWTPEQTAILAGASLWTYAAGQLINGWLGNRFNTRWMVLVGLAGSALLNLIFASLSSLPLMVGVWLINGFFQSMGWGPILRTLSDNLSSVQRQRISGLFGASYIVGNILTWALTGWLLHLGNWRLLFIVPALLMVGFAALWFLLNKQPSSSSVESKPVRLAEVLPILVQFWPMALTALVSGILFNSTLIYAPTYVAQYLPADQAALAATTFPVFGLIGTVWFGSWIGRRSGSNVLQTLSILLMLSAMSRAVQFLLPPSIVTSLILLAAMGVTTYALTNQLLTAVPLLAYAHLGTSTVAGAVDAVHSIGGAAGNTMVGFLLTAGGWPLVFGVWTLLPLVAIGIVSLVMRNRQVSPHEELAK
jgi:sugar phosphate permease